MFAIKAFPSTELLEGTTNLKGDEEDGYTILLYVVFFMVEIAWSDSVLVSSPFSFLAVVVFSPTMTLTGILPLFFTTPAIFIFPLESLNICCSGIIIASEAEAFENTPKRYDDDSKSTRRQDTKIPNNDCIIALIICSYIIHLY